MLAGLATKVSRIALVASFFLLPAMNGTVGTVAEAQEGPVAVEVTVDASGGEIVTIGIVVRNRTSSDVDPLRTAGSIPPNATVLGSWTGTTNEHPGKLEGQEISWFNSKIPADAIQGPFYYKVSMPRGSAGVFRAQAFWQNPSRGTGISPEVVVTIPPVAVPGAAVQRDPNQADFDIPGGRFYTQTNGRGSAADAGFAVVNGGLDAQGNEIRMYDGYLALGGPSRLGYPISRRYKEGANDAYTYQAFQNGALQWDPASKSARLTNLMDDMHGAQLDPLLERLGYARWEPDSSGGDFARARSERLSWLDDPNYADFKEAYFNSGADPTTFFGLPGGRPKTMGWIRVLRLQRAVFATYNNGPVVMASIGEDAVKVGYLAGDLLRLQSTSETDVAAWMLRHPGMTITASSPVTLKYREDWIATAPNCSATILRGDLRDIGGNPVNGELVKTWNDWGNEVLLVVGMDRGAGSWERFIGEGVRGGVWHVQIVHPTTGAALSPISTVRFTDQCSPTSVQEISLHYKANY
ncbi:MAG: hypothetical protein HY675_15820 [Chloroflexi bacterium]|nr:hypothetical protein [Chloroflexota bacterium]